MKPKTIAKKFISQPGAFNPGQVSSFSGYDATQNAPTIGIFDPFRVWFNDTGKQIVMRGDELLRSMERINNGSRDKGAILARLSFCLL